jgi:hypothetical protein
LSGFSVHHRKHLGEKTEEEQDRQDTSSVLRFMKNRIGHQVGHTVTKNWTVYISYVKKHKDHDSSSKINIKKSRAGKQLG